MQQSYSLPVRNAMTPRPFGVYHLPKPPSVQRSVFQVGLGTARNFHSSRPVFQNLVQNVPVAGRAICEADWKIKVKQEKQKASLAKKSSSKVKKTKEMRKPIEKVQKKVEALEIEEFDHYFAAPAFAETATYLLIPLAPTPTARNPLPASPSPSLLPISVLLDIHASHELHSLRVSSLFARLDVAQVWTNPGVSCSVYGDPSGLATILKVEFRGWSRAEVRSVLGEAGTGWCVLEEAHEDDLDSPSLSGVSTPATGMMEDEDFDSFLSSDSEDVDPANSLVIPSLDLSNHQAWSDMASPPSPLLIPPSSGPSDLMFDYDSDDSFSSIGSDDGDRTSWMAISVSSRVQEEEGPREYMF